MTGGDDAHGIRLHPVARIARADPRLVMVVLMALHLVVGLLTFAPVPHGGGDNTAYLTLARSIMDQGRYLELWDPARPPHTQYPPGFPLVLVAALGAGLRGWTALKLMMLGFSAAAVGVSYLWMRSRDAALALGVGAILAVAPGLVREAQWVLSDVPFWLATMGALLALERGRDGWGIALAFIALTLRTAGLPLVVAVLAWLALQRRWKTLAITAAVLVFLAIAWVPRSSAPGTGYVSVLWLENPYAPEAGRIGALGLLERMLENGDRYGFQILMRTLAGGGGVVGVVGGAFLIAFAGAGFVRRLMGSEEGESGDVPASGSTWGSRVGVAEIFTTLYVGMLLVWPETWASDRFLIPLLPVLLLYAAQGVGVFPGPGSRRAVRVAALVVIIGLGAPMAWAQWKGAAGCRDRAGEDGFPACLPPDQRSFIELAQWSRGLLREDAVVISRKPRQWYWYSGYPGRTYPFSTDRDRLLEEAVDAGARYLVLDALGATARVYLVPSIRENQVWFCLIRRVSHAGQGASLLGILSSPWDRGLLGETDDDALRLPRCPPSFQPDGGG